MDQGLDSTTHIMTKDEIFRYLILRTIGNFFILLSLFGVGATFGPALYYEVSFRIDQARGVHYVVADKHIAQSTPDGPLGQLKKDDNNKILMPNDTFFDIVIPKIGANAKIYANTDPGNETEYSEILTKGVAHAKGTVFPGMIGTTYLFAHSTDNWWNVGRYNAIFYLLKDLTQGDEVVVFFKDIRHNYVVKESRIIDPSDASYIIDAQKSPEQLIMQTCWPPGTTLKRLIVIAKPRGK